MGLELQSLALYVVAAFNRDSAKSTEAGLKYFVLGALSSGMLLYGASLVYGYTGSVLFVGHRRGDPGRGRVARAGPSGWCSSARRWPSRSRPRPSICGRPMSTKARRPR